MNSVFDAALKLFFFWLPSVACCLQQYLSKQCDHMMEKFQVSHEMRVKSSCAGTIEKRVQNRGYYYNYVLRLFVLVTLTGTGWEWDLPTVVLSLKESQDCRPHVQYDVLLWLYFIGKQKGQVGSCHRLEASDDG